MALGAANRGLNWQHRMDLTTESHEALMRLIDTSCHHPADAHETYFQANGENYRIRIERIPQPQKLHEANQ